MKTLSSMSVISCITLIIVYTKCYMLKRSRN